MFKILSIISVIIIVVLYKKYKNLENEKLDKTSQQISEKIKELEVLQEKVDNLSSISNKTKEQIQKEIDDWKEISIQKTSLEIENCINEIRENSFSSLQSLLEQYAKQKDVTLEEISTLEKTLEDFQKKQQTINEEITRRRKIQEQENFYRICLEEDALNDIEILNSIRKNLHNRSNLDKLIYDSYIAKPTLEMIKRVLNNKTPSGIYKITRLSTGEIYIGKSTNIKERWQQHVKTAFNAGTIAHSILHTTMQKDGVQNFTFEILEEVPKDKLGEREKYYIEFYDSKSYGLNERNGG